MRKLAYLPLFALLGATPGCFGNYLTAEEIRQAIDSVVLIGEARQAVDDVTEISTSFNVASRCKQDLMIGFDRRIDRQIFAR